MLVCRNIKILFALRSTVCRLLSDNPIFVTNIIDVKRYVYEILFYF